MKKIIPIALIAVLTSCAPTFREVFHLKNLTVVYTSNPTKECGRDIRACYFPQLKIIICDRRDPEACGHELCHATYRDSDHKGYCGRISRYPGPSKHFKFVDPHYGG